MCDGKPPKYFVTHDENRLEQMKKDLGKKEEDFIASNSFFHGMLQSYRIWYDLTHVM